MPKLDVSSTDEEDLLPALACEETEPECDTNMRTPEPSDEDDTEDEQIKIFWDHFVGGRNLQNPERKKDATDSLDQKIRNIG